RKVTINRPLHEVYEYLRFIRNQDQWSKWNRLDPEMKKTYTGEDGKIGFRSAWESDHKQVGVGQQTITALEENAAVYIKLEFLKPFKSESDSYLKTEKVDDTTTDVYWGFTGEMNPPMNVTLLFMNMDKRVGADFEEGLLKLKEVLEQSS
ncbi:MAG: SRPBCC family protein, partial [Saprospiraceae bacterium]|nr:SRPBCC family protein [Saprospiraceae bacterium]